MAEDSRTFPHPAIPWPILDGTAAWCEHWAERRKMSVAQARRVVLFCHEERERQLVAQMSAQAEAEGL